MNVLFVHPYGSNWMGTGKDITTIFNLMPPLGMMSIAAYLEARGIATEIIDCYASPMTAEALVAEILRRRPDVVGFSCTTSSFLEGYGVASLLKERAPEIVTVFGGAHACSVGVGLLDAFPAVAAGCRNVETIPGIGFRKEGIGTLSAVREHIADLDTLPFPAYHRLPRFPERYTLPLFSYPTSPNTSIISSRGCPYQCSYCDRSVFSRGFRFNSPEYIVEHLKMLNRDYGIRHVFFYDDLFTTDRSRVARFCELKEKERLPVTYNCIARLEHVDAELLTLLKRSGCWQVNFGIESGDPEVIKKHRTFYGLDDVQQKLQMVRQTGMRVKGLFMVGLPGENEMSIRRTIDYALQLPLDEINVTKFTPFPGAPLYATIREQGSFDEEWPLMNCMNFVFVPHGMTKEQLEGLYDEFIRRFYHRSRIHWGYTTMIWKSPHSILTFLRHLPEILAFEMKQKW
ncbi:MAG: radical SAM protein [Geobacter sp.]|nr:radical SAM protein [Geobacter sp.]